MHHLLATPPKIDLLQHLRPFWWVIPIFIILYVAKEILRNPMFKGWYGEKVLDLFTLKKLDPKKYKVLNDLYLPRPDGNGTTQLDHLVVSVHGISVIETKNYDHWIFGSQNQRKWTQKVFKKSHSFQNPLHQNDLHINALVKFLDADKALFHNLIFFVGGSTFKTEMPANVTDKGFRSCIESYTDEILTQEQADYVYQTLLSYDQSINRKLVAKQHIIDLKARTKS